MRLVCPNCDAEYEVDGALIPEGGRDVQCSACGHSWYQMPPETMAAEAEEAALYDAQPAAGTPPDAMTDAGQPAPPPPAPPAAAPSPAPEAAPASTAPAPEAPLRAGRSLDESLLAVLKDEAEREARARRGERPGLETQTEMPLTGSARAVPRAEDADADTRAMAPMAPPAPVAPSEPAAPVEPAAKVGPATMALQKIARLRGQPAPAPAEPVKTPPPSRRDLFPGIEEVNSTLRAAGEPRDADQGAVSDTIEDEDAPTNGFRNGFLTVMVVVILGAFLYVFAPVIASQVPSLAGPMTAYVQAVDALRLLVDTVAKGLIIKLQSITRGQG
jgi:predicted Zn finger-like uncharacterized protein